MYNNTVCLPLINIALLLKIKKAGSLSDLQSNIELVGGGSEGLLLSRLGFLQGTCRWKYLRKIHSFLNTYCPRL